MSTTDIVALVAIFLVAGIFLLVLGVSARSSRRRARGYGRPDGSVFAATTLAGDGGGHCSPSDGGGGSCDGGGGGS